MISNNVNSEPEFEFFDRNPTLPDVILEVLNGLSGARKKLSSKYFYDTRGLDLFQQITELPEYYLTRAEIGILKNSISKIACALGPELSLIEYGSGDSRKIRILLDACDALSYIPIDISRNHLVTNARLIFKDYSNLNVYPVCADYTKPLEIPVKNTHHNLVGYFPGSSIGNFEPSDARLFLRRVRDTVGFSGRLLIGVDTKKSTNTLNAAYNDESGVTKAFNLNLLHHLNARIGTNFNTSEFEHLSYYNKKLGRIEIYLVSTVDQLVSLNGQTFRLKEGERIHTEHSYKYSLDEFILLAEDAGFEYGNCWSDRNAQFMLLLLRTRK